MQSQTLLVTWKSAARSFDFSTKKHDRFFMELKKEYYNLASFWSSGKCYRDKTSLRKDFVEKSFFSIWVFFHNHSQITGVQRKEEGISLTPH